MEHSNTVIKHGDCPKMQSKENHSKLSRFEEFARSMKILAVEGSNKYAGGEPYKKEAIDIIPDILTEEGYVSYVLGDLLKRVIRFKNQRRERDLVKIALWSYLLWMRFFPKQDREGPKPHGGMD